MLKSIKFLSFIVFMSVPGLIFAQPTEKSKTKTAKPAGTKQKKVATETVPKTSAAPTAVQVTVSTQSSPEDEALKKRAMATYEEDKSSERPEIQYGLGFQFSYNYIPDWFLHIGLRASHTVQSASYGARFIIRKKHVDIIFKGVYWNINPPNGNWLGIQHDWDETDYVEFENLSLTYGEVSAIWNTELFKNFYFIYGGGIGGGYVGGNIYTTPTTGCTADNWQVATTNGIGCSHDPNDLRREKESIPRGMGVLEATLGFRFDFTENISAKIETGIFLPGFIYGTASFEIFF